MFTRATPSAGTFRCWKPIFPRWPGRARYGVMLAETGSVMDDGIFVRLVEDHFLLNTTSSSAGMKMVRPRDSARP